MAQTYAHETSVAGYDVIVFRTETLRDVFLALLEVSTQLRKKFFMLVDYHLSEFQRHCIDCIVRSPIVDVVDDILVRDDRS